MAPALIREQFLPLPPLLRPVIQHVVLLSVDAGAAPVVHTLLPTFQAVLLVNLGPGAELWPLGSDPLRAPLRLTTTLLAGPLKTGWQYRLPGGARVLALTFTLGGFYRLFGVPANGLPPGFADPAGLPGPDFAGLGEQLRPLAHPAQFARAVADFCRPFLRPAEAAQAALLAQLPQLTRPSHLNPLQVMATADQVSERTLQLRFQKYLGFSAKEAVRFLRFRHLLNALRHREPAGDKKIDWFALLERFGYYDQSHLVHDFTHFLHQSPTQTASLLLTGDALCLPQTQLLTE